jgi:bis(5'-nucleosidyl)-tetraphosphatase
MTPLTQQIVGPPSEESARPTRLSAGVVVVSVFQRKLKFLLLRAYRNWDFPKGMVEPGEDPIDAAVREVREETTLDDISFDWGMAFMDTGPYNRGKISRYYVARSKQERVELLVNPEIGMPEHQEARWVDVDRAHTMVSPRLKPVIDWAYRVINHGQAQRPEQSAPPPA